MMGTDTAQDADHGALMDSVYKGQRHIYDLTRKYYLFGRDTLIEGLNAEPGMRVLEVACGTGRNLAKIGKAWPGAQLYGLDISAEMLKNAGKSLGQRAYLEQGDACSFEPRAVFGDDAPEGGFDRIAVSYALSMIPDWEAALSHAAGQLAPGGELHLVDFGDLSGLPGPFQRMMHGWLAKFHVQTRTALPQTAARLATDRGMELTSKRGKLGYFQLHVLKAA